MKVIYTRIRSYGWHLCSVVLILVFFLLSCSDELKIESFIPAAEFEEQESTLICWNAEFQELIIHLADVIAEQDHVTLFYNERGHNPKKIFQLLKDRKVNITNVSLVPFNLEKDNIWIRDYGPTFMLDENGGQEVVTFRYPHEDNQEYNLFNQQYASRMRLSFMKSKLSSAGGGREINGKGTIILVEGYEKSINPDLSIEEIENEYKQRLNQKKIIWLKRGIPQDDAFDNGPVLDNIYGNGINWHLDEFCRFADAETILLAQVDVDDLRRDPFYQVIHERLEESFKILSEAKDQDGKPFKIIRVPQAPVIFNDAKYNGNDIYYTPVTSYLNFVLTNHSVVVPSYYSQGDPEYIREKDEAARKVFQQIFKNRKVMMCDALDLNYRGGGLHCITIAQPKLKKRKNRIKGIFG